MQCSADHIVWTCHWYVAFHPPPLLSTLSMPPSIGIDSFLTYCTCYKMLCWLYCLECTCTAFTCQTYEYTLACWALFHDMPLTCCLHPPTLLLLLPSIASSRYGLFLACCTFDVTSTDSIVWSAPVLACKASNAMFLSMCNAWVCLMVILQ